MNYLKVIKDEIIEIWLGRRRGVVKIIIENWGLQDTGHADSWRDVVLQPWCWLIIDILGYDLGIDFLQNFCAMHDYIFM